MTPKSPDGVVCCEVGGERFAFQGADVRFVGRAEQIAGPSSPDGCLGVMPHGGTMCPIYGLASLLGLPAQRVRGTSHVVVTSGAYGPFGVAVDRAVRIGLAQRFEVLSLPAFVGPKAGRWFGGLLLWADQSCLLLSPAGLDPAGPAYAHPEAFAPARAASAPSRQANAARTFVTFTTSALPPCGADRFAISTRHLGAVIRTLPVVSLPGAPGFVTGLSWWQGRAVPLVDFRDGRRVASTSRHLMIRSQAGACAGLPVDADITLHRPGEDGDHVSVGEAAFVAGLFAVGEGRVALIDVDALLATEAPAPAPVAACVG